MNGTNGGYLGTPETGQVTVYMLGKWQVFRSDGTAVGHAEWKTGKTADLLRMLALRAGQPVAVDVLVATLWPAADRTRALGSLRTAVSLIRRLIGSGAVARSALGISLERVWVDTAVFAQVADEVRRLLRSGDHAGAESAGRRALQLYHGDFSAHDDSAEWVRASRQSLARCHYSVLCDVADAVLQAEHPHEAVDFASQALSVNRYSERASRLLMRSWQLAGEHGLALREYERCRLSLAEDLGVDPSPETRAVHLSILSADRDALAAVAPPRPHIDVAALKNFARRDVGTASGDKAAATTGARTPLAQIRALTTSCMPDALLGRPDAAHDVIEKAIALAATTGDQKAHRRLEVLQCLVAHDLDSPQFPALWARAVRARTEEPDVLWSWVTMRIATERHDLTGARAAMRPQVATHSGWLGRHLHKLASAVLLAELDDRESALRCLRDVLQASELARSSMLVHEALARAVSISASVDRAAAEAAAVPLSAWTVPAYPREAYLRLLADAGLEAARGRVAASVAAAANAAQVAADNHLPILAASATALWSRSAHDVSMATADRWLSATAH